MSLYHKPALLLFTLTTVVLALYSYALVDPNFTLLNVPAWTSFRNVMVEFGYYNGQTSALVYLLLIAALYYFHMRFTRNADKVPLQYLLGVLGILAICSYPFLSHDLFNYMFDARILTVYGQNPYTHKALDFAQDDWLRFMHWTHRAYPYGPTFLPLTLVPSFLSLGKLILNMLFFKLFFFGFFAAATAALYKLNKKWGIYFATNPLVIIEGLVNAHNDLIAVSLAIIGIYVLRENKTVWAKLIFVISAGIKYITLPFIFVGKKEGAGTRIAFALTLVVLAYLTFFAEIQGWYFLVLLGFIPYYVKIVDRLTVLNVGLLAAYYPYVRSAGWGDDQIGMKHLIIAVSFVLFLLSFRLRKHIVLEHV